MSEVKRYLASYLYETTSGEAMILKDTPGVYVREVVMASDYEAALLDRAIANTLAEKALAATPAVWSREKPTEPGWYWYQSNGIMPCCVEVAWWNGHPLVAFFISGRSGKVEEIGGEWSSSQLRPPVEGKHVEHVCGLQGFGRGMGSENDECPACNKARRGHD